MCTLCVTLIKAGLTEASLPRSFCEDDSLSSSDGGYGSAKADRPPRVYISPARLCDSRTLHARPHPRDRFPPLSVDPPPKHPRPITRTPYFGYGIFFLLWSRDRSRISSSYANLVPRLSTTSHHR